MNTIMQGTPEQLPQRVTVTETQMVLDIIANTDTVPPTEVVEKLVTMANKWRYDEIGVAATGDIFTCSPRDDGGHFLSPRGDTAYVIIDQNGIIPAPWSDELIIAIKKSYELYSLDWLTGG
jgi:hypothetical protein